MSMSLSPIENTQAAARALLAFWRQAGVDMAEAEAVYAAAPASAATPKPAAPLPREAQTPAKGVTRPMVADAPILAAREAAAAAQTLAELQAAVERFELCPLKGTARNTVFADGVPTARVLLIGEAPGKDEDEKGKPFVGRAGQMLDKMLASIGLDRRENVFISNTIYWRPPGNRDPTPGETAVCLPFVERLITLMQPELLLLIGGVAAKTLLQRSEGVTKLRGKALTFERPELSGPINAMVMLHPAYLLRRPQEKRLAWADLLLAAAKLDALGVERGSAP
jgi:DNA polymerase